MCRADTGRKDGQVTKDELKNSLVLEDVRYKKLLKGDISLFKKKMTLLDPDLDSHFKAAALQAGHTESTVIRAMIRLFVTKTWEGMTDATGRF